MPTPPVPGSHNGPFEQGQLTDGALAARLEGEICSWGKKSKFISSSCRGNECQFPKQNCYFSARLTVAWELEGGQAAAFNFRCCGINAFLAVGSAGGDAHLVGSTPRRNGGHLVPISSSIRLHEHGLLSTLGQRSTDGEGGETVVMLILPLPTSFQGTHPRLWEGTKLPV